MQITALCHTEMARELVTLRMAVSSAMEFALGRGSWKVGKEPSPHGRVD
jgi:hypothetical protein